MSMKTIQPIQPLLTALLALFFLASSGEAQLIIPEIEIDVQRLPQESQVRENVAELDTTLVLYFGDRQQDWNRDLEKYDLPIQINIYVTDYFPNPNEDRYKAQLIITNKRETRFDDKRWEFGLNPPFSFRSGQFHPLTSVIEFYVRMLIGIEEDKFEKFGGDRFFDSASQLTLTYSQSNYIEGWDKRTELLRDYTSESNETFRELNFYYYTGIFYDEEQDFENSEIYLRYALIKLERIDAEKRRQFLESNHQEFAAAIANAAVGRGETALIRAEEGIQSPMSLDPARREIYESYLPTQEEDE
ncbi:DUF4835 family protein [bacterium]|nr:DUF4835 family protein [bacterium]